MQTSQRVYMIGDIHGQLKKLLKILHHANLIDEKHSWTGGNATLWFMGDFVDRGPDGIGVLDLVMRLQREAQEAGGQVASLLGNHEVLLLSAQRFGRRLTGMGMSFLSIWKLNGGNRKDMAGLTQRHIDWLVQLPAMAHVDDHLLVHADAPLYLKFGSTVDEVNDAFRKLLSSSNALDWDEILDDFSRRGVFLDERQGEAFASRFLKQFGGRRLVHGHTPISSARGCSPKSVTEPWIYAGEQCVNIDGGLFLGGPGFVYQIAQKG